MDLFVYDSSRRSDGVYRLRADDDAVVMQLSADGASEINRWARSIDPARFEKQMDGRSIRIGMKRFVVTDETSNEVISEWMSIHSGQKTDVDTDTPGRTDPLENLLEQGQLSPAEFEQIRGERLKKDRLQALREQGLLTDEELELIGAQPTMPVVQPPVPPQPSRYQAPPSRQVVYSRSTNGFAIASFVLSLVGGSLLAVIFGHIALSQINRTREGGRGLAIAGLIIGYVTLAIITILVFAAVTSDPGYYEY